MRTCLHSPITLNDLFIWKIAVMNGAKQSPGPTMEKWQWRSPVFESI